MAHAGDAEKSVEVVEFSVWMGCQEMLVETRAGEGGNLEVLLAVVGEEFSAENREVSLYARRVVLGNEIWDVVDYSVERRESVVRLLV